MLGLLLVLGAWSCGSSTSQSPALHAGSIRFGVDPQREAVAVTEAFQKAGYRLVARSVGDGYVALGFADVHGVSRGVRVVTVRGLELALDSVPKGPLADRLEFYLAEPPLTVGTDVDGDGQDEIPIREVGRPGGDCIALFRVQPGGHVQPVSLDLARFGVDACVRSMRDGDGDGRVELVVPFEVEGLPLPRWPKVNVLLAPDGEQGFGLAPLSADDRAYGDVQRYYDGQQQVRADALVGALRLQDAAEVYRLVAELMLLKHLRGRPVEELRRATQAHFEQVAARNREVEAAIMAHVRDGW